MYAVLQIPFEFHYGISKTAYMILQYPAQNPVGPPCSSEVVSSGSIAVYAPLPSEVGAAEAGADEHHHGDQDPGGDKAADDQLPVRKKSGIASDFRWSFGILLLHLLVEPRVPTIQELGVEEQIL